MTKSTAIQAVRDDMNRLRGKLFGAIEAAGLPQRQEDALKRIIRQQTYATQADVESALRRKE
jgi:hypothetical protein